MPWLFVLLAIPLIEVFLFATVGAAVGPWVTLGLVLLTAFIGVNLLRYQGLATARRAQQRIRMGELPETELLDGLMLAVGGFFLLTPGFLTDFVGFCLLIPLSRHWLRKNAIASLFNKQKQAQKQQHGRDSERESANPEVIICHHIHRSGTAQTHRTETSQETHSEHRHTIEGEFRQD